MIIIIIIVIVVTIIINYTMNKFKYLKYVSNVVKFNMLNTIKIAKTGHLGACCSSNELMAVLYFSDILRYDINNPNHTNRDYVLVRGHVGPLRYNIFALMGWMDASEMFHYKNLDQECMDMKI